MLFENNTILSLWERNPKVNLQQLKYHKRIRDIDIYDDIMLPKIFIIQRVTHAYYLKQLKHD